MRELFNVAELVRIGIEDESSGVVFYSALAKTVSTPRLREIFAELAEQEKFHKARFEQMLTSLGIAQPKEEYPGEYTEYLRTLTSQRAFPDQAAAMRLAQECKNDMEAIELAIRFERDTIMLMNEMRMLLPSGDSDIVNELVREEQSHLVTLNDARRQARPQ